MHITPDEINALEWTEKKKNQRNWENSIHKNEQYERKKVK